MRAEQFIEKTEILSLNKTLIKSMTRHVTGVVNSIKLRRSE